MATPAPITVDEFVQLETSETEAYELVDGVLIPLPSPTPLHAVILGRIAKLVRNHFDHNPIGSAIADTGCRCISFSR
jgi:Uma2 family endonuclease